MGLMEYFLRRNKDKKLKILVVGDVVIDEYYQVSVDRVSPEFPVPIIASESEEYEAIPGAAANVCRQLKNMNVDVFLASLLSPYAARLCSKFGINSNYSSVCSIRSPVKRRFYDNEFPLCRWDIEKKDYGCDELMFAFRRDLLALTNGIEVDIIVLSDYGKGVFDSNFKREIISRSRRAGIRTVVDPKSGFLGDWRGCSIFKPNFKEARGLTSMGDELSCCKQIMDVVDCEAVVVTNEEKAITCFTKDRNFKCEPKLRSVVRSTSGAGDVFCGFLALATAHGFSLEDSVVIAHTVSDRYVGDMNHVPLLPHQIMGHVDIVRSKYIDLFYNDLSWRRDVKLAFCNGCFDAIHSGHLSTLRYAKEVSDKVLVAINSDDSVTMLKGPSRPIFSLEQRMEMLANLSCVDFVTSFREETPLELIKRVNPDVLVKGGDWEARDIVGNDLSTVKIAPYKKGYSTTGMVEKIKSV